MKNMKRILALLTAALILCMGVFLVSCNYQDTVDSARSNLMETTKDLLDPFLNQTKSSTENDEADSDVSSGETSGSGKDDLKDIEDTEADF